MTIAAEHDMARVRQIVETIFNQGELAAADALFTPDYVNHGGLIPDLVHGPEAIKVAVALYRTAFPAFHVTIAELRVDGATILLRWVAHDGAALAPSADAASADRGSLAGTTRARFIDQRIAESWTSWDAEGTVQRWGLVRVPDAAGMVCDV
jgi:predicted SnoaL-like aldol condensation-catalyzing enzyme